MSTIRAAAVTATETALVAAAWWWRPEAGGAVTAAALAAWNMRPAVDQLNARVIHGTVGRVRRLRARSSARHASRLAEAAAERVLTGWQQLITDAGWDKRRPTLVSARASGPAVDVTWRPALADDEAAWERQAHTIRRWLGAPTMRWRVHEDDAGICIASFGMSRLPKRIDLDRPPAPAGVGRDAEFWLGPAAGGHDAVWRPYESPHLRVSGPTGKGKGGTLRIILAQAIGDWDIRVINGKGGGEFEWLRPHGAMVEHDPDRVLAMLQGIESGRQDLQAIIREHHCDDWTYLPVPKQRRPVLLVVDEATSIMDSGDKTRERIAAAISLLVREGRSAGIHLLITGQRLDVASGALGAKGGAVREQLSACIAVGNLGEQGLRMAGFPPEAARLLSHRPGRAVVMGLDATSGGDVHQVQVAWLPPEVVASTPVRREAAAATPTGPVPFAGSVSGSGSGWQPPLEGAEEAEAEPETEPETAVGTACAAADGGSPDRGGGSTDGAGGRAAADDDAPAADPDHPAADAVQVAGEGGAPGGGPDGGVSLAEACRLLDIGERAVRAAADNPLDHRVTKVSRGRYRVTTPTR